MRVLLQGFALALVAFTALTRPALAEDFPSRPITILVPLAPGGGVDFVARTIGQKLSERLGKPVLIENRPGGGTVVAAVALAKARPDGYTLLLTPGATLSSNTAVYKSLPYDPRRDFVPIALPSQVAFTLVINPSLPVKSIPELIQYAKDKPGELIVGTAGIATTTHLAGELLAFKTGIQLRYAHYRGSPPAMNDVIAGSIQMMFADPVTGAELAKAGKVRALGVTGKNRVIVFPDVPPIADSVPGYDATNWHMILAPAQTPPEIVEKLSAEIRAIVALPEIRQQIEKIGLEPLDSPAPAELRTFLDADITTWTNLVKQIGLATTRQRHCRRSPRARRIFPWRMATRCSTTSKRGAAPRAGRPWAARSASPTGRSGRAMACTSRCGRMSGPALCITRGTARRRCR